MGHTEGAVRRAGRRGGGAHGRVCARARRVARRAFRGRRAGRRPRARTVVCDGYRFDLGGHRFFTKSDEVQRVWNEVLGEARPKVQPYRVAPEMPALRSGGDGLAVAGQSIE